MKKKLNFRKGRILKTLALIPTRASIVYFLEDDHKKVVKGVRSLNIKKHVEATNSVRKLIDEIDIKKEGIQKIKLVFPSVAESREQLISLMFIMEHLKLLSKRENLIFETEG